MTTLLLCTLYVVIVMVIVSLSLTYKLTYKLFGGLLGETSQLSYGTGMDFNQSGFLLHIIVFALLVGIPMYLYKKN